MLFNSYVFIYAFLPIVLIVYHSIRNNEKKLLWLTIASYYFYSYWNFKLAFLILFSTVIDYIAGKNIAKTADARKKRLWLIASIVTNLGLLGFFKYCNFFLQSFAHVSSACGLGVVIPHLNIILPVGISFYTFQSMSYTIDLYRGKVRPVKNFIHFACYVSMFPQLVAGPIVRFSEIAEQLETRSMPLEKVKRGITFFIIGLGKKVLIADSVALIVDAWWGAGNLTALTAWIAVLAYALQIYYDFSGYSDMACGLGYLLGFDFPQNFNSPYKARSITDFWQRWHMSLSHWLRDFLYISIGGNRRGYLRTYTNLFITMFLGGLWHGAQWTFVAWGCYHGLLLAGERRWRDTGRRTLFPVYLQQTVTGTLVLLGWVLFRSTSFPEALYMYRAMFGLLGLGSFEQLTAGIPIFIYAFLLMMVVITVTQKNTWEMKFTYTVKLATVLSCVFVLSVFVILVNVNSPFLYFQF